MEAAPETSALILFPSNGLMRDVAQRENTTPGCTVRPDVDLAVHGMGEPSPSAWLPRLY